VIAGINKEKAVQHSWTAFLLLVPLRISHILAMFFDGPSTPFSGTLSVVNLLQLYRSKRFLLLFLLLGSLSGRSRGAANASPELQVSPCSRVSLSASYLAELKPGTGPSYHFRLSNDTEHPIVLARPVPTSAHWFTRDGEHWYWRASVGGGGSLVDAMVPNGKMFVYQATQPLNPSQILKVAAHSVAEWEEAVKENPTLEFKPSCSICNHPADREFRAIFAYAYLPMPADKPLGLLPCGIRSTPVDVPPIR